MRATDPSSAAARGRLIAQDNIRDLVDRLARDILARYRADENGPLAVPPGSLCLVGVRTGGAHLAARLGHALTALAGEAPPIGVLDITLYRDDVVLGPNPMPVLRGTDIPFDIHQRYVVLVDDVLYTGRTVRAALDALLDLGRPACVRLAVLVDRGLRELPVAADFCGAVLATTKADHVRVRLVEGGASEDEVVIEAPAEAKP